MERIYLDTCCWGRPWDGKGHASIVAEADAVVEIIDWRYVKGYIAIGSPVIDAEILDNPKPKDRGEIMAFYADTIDRYIDFTPDSDIRARGFQAKGLRVNDSHHLALAERAGVGILLTVDKQFLKVAANKNLSRVNVINPLVFIGG